MLSRFGVRLPRGAERHNVGGAPVVINRRHRRHARPSGNPPHRPRRFDYTSPRTLPYRRFPGLSLAFGQHSRRRWRASTRGGRRIAGADPRQKPPRSPRLDRTIRRRGAGYGPLDRRLRWIRRRRHAGECDAGQCGRTGRRQHRRRHGRCRAIDCRTRAPHGRYRWIAGRGWGAAVQGTRLCGVPHGRCGEAGGPGPARGHGEAGVRVDLSHDHEPGLDARQRRNRQTDAGRVLHTHAEPERAARRGAGAVRISPERNRGRSGRGRFDRSRVHICAARHALRNEQERRR